MALETVIENLRDGYAQLQPGTMLHADQLMAAQVKDPTLRTQAFYVADGPLYSLEGKKQTPTLWLTREADNLVLRHLNDKVNSSYEQLVKNGNYRPDAEEARKSMEAKGTLRIDLTKLRLQGDDAQWRYVEISTSKYKKLNAEDRKLAERFYGQGKKLSTAMATLNEAGISNTRVYVLNPEYVRQEAHEGPVGRAAWRNSFNYVSADSYANGHYVLNRSGLRGVRLGEARSAAPEKLEVPVAPAAAPEMKVPSIEQMLALSQRYVPECGREEFQKELRKLYK